MTLYVTTDLRRFEIGVSWKFICDVWNNYLLNHNDVSGFLMIVEHKLNCNKPYNNTILYSL